jgi:hypothetical protein
VLSGQRIILFEITRGEFYRSRALRKPRSEKDREQKMQFMTKTLAVIAVATCAFSSISIAGQPARPGAFGTDRAQGVQNFQTGGIWDAGKPGSSEWGKIAGERAGTNGTVNQEYKDAAGGSPTQGK